VNTLNNDAVNGVEDVHSRVIFYDCFNETATMRVIAVSHVVLDPFPASGFLGNSNSNGHIQIIPNL
jgi:hypothetical protein